MKNEQSTKERRLFVSELNEFTADLWRDFIKSETSRREVLDIFDEAINSSSKRPKVVEFRQRLKESFLEVEKTL